MSGNIIPKLSFINAWFVDPKNSLSGKMLYPGNIVNIFLVSTAKINFVYVCSIKHCLCYFAVVMKAHVSHDVLLLCQRCHAASNISDVALRKRLAEMCDAPIQKKRREPYKVWKVQLDAIKTLQSCKISQKKKNNLEAYLKLVFNYTDLSPEVLETLREKLEKDAHSMEYEEDLNESVFHGAKVREKINFLEKWYQRQIISFVAGRGVL